MVHQTILVGKRGEQGQCRIESVFHTLCSSLRIHVWVCLVGLGDVWILCWEGVTRLIRRYGIGRVECLTLNRIVEAVEEQLGSSGRLEQRANSSLQDRWIEVES